jgi:Protein of unknown function (DUF732)
MNCDQRGGNLMLRILRASAAVAASLTGGAMGASPTARADCGPGFSTNSNGNGVDDRDTDYLFMLTNPTDNDNPLRVWNFPLAKAQGLLTCQRIKHGETLMEATDHLTRPEGPYTADDAISITSAAIAAYCPLDFTR